MTHDHILQFAEELGQYFESRGLGRTSGKILAWLMVCEPAEQSMDDIAGGLGLAKSTLSPELRLLTTSRMIEKLRLPGQRRDFYRMTPGFWSASIESALDEFVWMRTIARHGLDLLEGQPAERQVHLREMFEMYDFLAERMPGLIAEWKATRED